MITGKFPGLRLRRNRKTDWSRRLIAENNLTCDDFILPIFLIDGKNKKQAIIRCLAQKLLIYGIGRGLTFKDRVVVDDVIRIGKQEEIKLADLVFKVIQSKPFQLSQ